MNLYFNEGFKLERENMVKLISVISRFPHATNQQIAEASGIGIGKNEKQGKVKPTINYAIYGGLLSLVNDERRRLNLTDVGKIVVSNDPWLKKITTLWVMHYHLTKEGSEAGAWTFFVHSFLPHNTEFDQALLKNELVTQFNVRPRSVAAGAILKSYTDGDGLGSIRLVCETRRKYTRTQPYIPNVYTVAYLLAELWEAKHPDRTMVDPSLLSEKGHLGSTMNLNVDEIHTWLNQMNAAGIITQMREAPPYQVVRRWHDKLELLQKSFDEEG
jgi:hypothetical protein